MCTALDTTSLRSEKEHLIQVALGKTPADLVLKHARYLNVFSNELCEADIAIVGSRIAGIGDYSCDNEMDMEGHIVLPGFIDGHVHLESSLVTPKELTRALIPHGTTTVVTDPHEITNVMGTEGIEYILQATKDLPIDVRVMLPSCVPATPLDESGAILHADDIDAFYQDPHVSGLAEFMNVPGVLNCDDDAMEKLTAAQMHHKLIDGHAPMIPEKDLNAYVAAGVGSDHECFALDDAISKLQRGQYIMIREGTAAQNLEALMPLLTPQYAGRCLFCVDDRHPNDLLDKGHIDHICRKAVSLGADPLLVAKVATFNAASYFRLYDRGAIAPGYHADLVIIDDLQHFQVERVFKDGKLTFDDGTIIPFEPPHIAQHLIDHAHDTFDVSPIGADDLADARHHVIGMVPGEIVTTDEGIVDAPSVANDILKIAVVERHHHTGHIGNGYIKGYGLTKGAIATSISHDSHNIIVVGTNAEDMAFAVNRIIEMRGGIVVVENQQVVSEVTLEIGGIMTDSPIADLNRDLEAAKAASYERGVSSDIDPFMSLSFMALPVISTLRITTQGVFNSDIWGYVD